MEHEEVTRRHPLQIRPIITIDLSATGVGSPWGYDWCLVAAYTLMRRYRFLGTDYYGLGSLTLADIICFVSDASRTGDFRIRDVTNDKTICEVTGVATQTEGNVEAGLIVSNLSASFAMWEVQAAIDSTDGGHFVGMSQVLLR